MLMSLIVQEIYIACTKSDSFTLYLIYHIYQKLPGIAYIFLVLVNTLGTCGKVECFLWNHIVNLFYEDRECGLVRDHESSSQNYIRSH